VVVVVQVVEPHLLVVELHLLVVELHLLVVEQAVERQAVEQAVVKQAAVVEQAAEERRQLQQWQIRRTKGCRLELLLVLPWGALLPGFAVRLLRFWPSCGITLRRSMDRMISRSRKFVVLLTQATKQLSKTCWKA
jgi:hypothetical protein